MSDKDSFDPTKAVIIHASAVRMNGGAAIFLGPSGAGKSTIRRLLAEVTQPLADDVIYLIPRTDGGWMVADVSRRKWPLSEAEIAVLEGVPLQAVFRLHQTSQPRLERIDTLGACHCLMAAHCELLVHKQDGNETRQVFSQLAVIAQSVPVYRLYFDRSPQTVKIIADEINACKAADDQE